MSQTAEQAQNNWAALGHAERLGLRPNIALDINFGVGGLMDPDRNASSSLRAFLKLARQWIERRGGRTAYIYALENRYSGIGETGVHAHILIHVPDDLREDFHSQKRIWARNPEVGMTWRPGLFGPKGKSRKPIPSQRGVMGKLAYMTKDASPAFLAAFEPFINASTGKPWLHDSDKPSNAPIYGKKAGVSRNIDAGARAAYHRAWSASPDGLAGGEAINAADNSSRPGDPSFRVVRRLTDHSDKTEAKQSSAGGGRIDADDRR